MRALHMLDVLDCEEVAYGGKTRWLYSLADGIKPAALDPAVIPGSSPDSATPSPRETTDSPTDEDTSLLSYVGMQI
jgi:hypothetical protein